MVPPNKQTSKGSNCLQITYNILPRFLREKKRCAFYKGTKITNHGYNNLMCKVHKNVGAHYTPEHIVYTGQKGNFIPKTKLKNILFKILFTYFLEREKGREKRGRETSMCGCLSHAPYWGPGPATQASALTGNRTSDHLAHRPALNLPSHASQDKAQEYL